MFKKTFYTLFALGAMIIIGSTASGFVSANTPNETTVETTPSTGKWIAGTVNTWGYVLDEGTGGWTVERTGFSGQYVIQGPPGAKHLVATYNGDYAGYANVDVLVTTEKDINLETGESDGRFRVYLYDIRNEDFISGTFSFVMYVQ